MTHAIAALLVFAALQDKVDPAKHPWAKFKEGTWVRVQTTTTMAGLDMPKQLARRIVKSVTAEAVTVTTEDGMGVHDEVLPLVVKAPAEKPVMIEKGSEDIVVDGKTYACKILEGTVKSAAGDVKTTTWTCDAAPGGMVKLAVKAPTYELTSALIKVKETVTIGGKAFACSVTETKIEMMGTPTTSRQWSSPDMPGSFVKMTTSVPDSMESVQEVVEFEIK